MKMVSLELYSRFRGLQPDFKIEFLRPLQQYNKIEPLCFVGLNGSGKSNLMQGLAEIFFYLETFSLPETQQYTIAETWFGFRIHYLLPVTVQNALSEDDSNAVSSLTWRNVIITKTPGQNPVFEYYYADTESKKRVQGAEMFSKLLPNQIIGYSSGMNEMISVPFTKMDFYYLDEMKRKESERTNESTDEFDGDNSQVNFIKPDIYRLYFLSYQNNSLAVLANYLFRDFGDEQNAKEMDIINRLLEIKDLHSFRIGFNYKVQVSYSNTELLRKITLANIESITNSAGLYSDFIKKIQIPYALQQTLQKLIECSTTVRLFTDNDFNPFDINNFYGIDESDSKNENVRIELHYKVDENLKRAFRDKFPGGAMKFFGELYLLNLLNIENYSEQTQQQVKQGSLETNIHEFLPKVSEEEKVFHVDAVRFKKKNGSVVYYKQLSDGEHQYLQVTGSLMLIDENASLFLLDEPETHFNPEWRSKLISSLNQILELKIKADPGLFIPQQEIILTTHSPFVVSDCRPEMVYVFQRNNTNNLVEFKKPDFNTYGASVNLLTAKIFDKKETIAEMVNEKLVLLKKEFETGLKTKEQVMQSLNGLGDSVEKIIFIDSINSKIS
jgi:restriction system-associated AAA family ATPase